MRSLAFRFVRLYRKMGVLPVCMSAHHLCASTLCIPGEATDGLTSTLDLELEKSESCHGGAGN